MCCHTISNTECASLLYSLASYSAAHVRKCYSQGLACCSVCTVLCCLAGGGVALLYASKALDAVKEKLDNFDQTVGVQILQTALRVPLKTIADNAGMAPAECMRGNKIWSAFTNELRQSLSAQCHMGW